MMKKNILPLIVALSITLTINSQNKRENMSTTASTKIDKKVDSLLGIMTLKEKIGQMNQYNGFWDVTGPSSKGGDATKKHEHIKAGLVG